jgi:H+/gluconate symporter-like permease
MRQRQTHPTHILDYVRQEVGAAMRHLIVALLVAMIGGLAVEIGELLMTRQEPTIATHITATVVALLLGYAVAITVLFRALLRGIGQGAEWVTNEIEEAAWRILHTGGSETGEGTRRVATGNVVNAASAPLSSETAPAGHTPTLEDGMLAGFPAE